MLGGRQRRRTPLSSSSLFFFLFSSPGASAGRFILLFPDHSHPARRLINTCVSFSLRVVAVGICFSAASPKGTSSNNSSNNNNRSMSEPVADIALYGLAVMGQNVILNMNDHGFVVCAFNRSVTKVRGERNLDEIYISFSY